MSGIKKSFVRLRVCLSVSLLITLSAVSSLSQHATRQNTQRFDPDGTFWIHGDPPAEFSEFDSINLNAKRLRYLNSPGLRTRTANHRFKTLTVKRDNFTFTTMTVRGISYSFTGRFLKGGVYASGILDEETPVLEGTLTRFRDGQKVAAAKLKFTYFGGT